MKRTHLCLSVVLGGLAAFGCCTEARAQTLPPRAPPATPAGAGQKTPNPKNADKAPSVPASAEKKGPDQGVPEFQPPPVSDPMLAPPPPAPREIRTWEETLQIIRANSPDYLSSFENVKRAEAQTRIALASVLPTLNATGQYTHQFEQATFVIGGLALTTPPADTFTGALNLQWNVLNARGYYGYGTAKKNVDATKKDFEDRRRMIAITVASTVLQTLALERVAELNRTGLKTALERLALAQARFDFGRGTQLDIDRGQQDAENARAQVLTGDENLRQGRENLGIALGMTTPVSAPTGMDLDGFEAGVTRTCKLNDDIEGRPDVAAARARVELSERAIRDVELEFVPTVSVFGTASQSNVAVLGPKTVISAGGLLTIPLYDGGSRYGQLKQRRAEAEQAKQALSAVRLNAVTEASRARRAVSVTEETLEVAKRQRDLAARIDARTRDGYAQGAGTSLDLVLSAQSLRQAEINLALLEFRYAQARVTAVLTNAECVY